MVVLEDLRDALKSLRRLCQTYKTVKRNSGVERECLSLFCICSVTMLYIRLDTESVFRRVSLVFLDLRPSWLEWLFFIAPALC